MIPSTVSPPSSPKRDQPDVKQAFHTFLRNAANHPSPIPPGVTGKYWLYLDPLVLQRVSPDTYQRAKIQQTITGDVGGRLAEFARSSMFDYFADTSTIMISREQHRTLFRTGYLKRPAEVGVLLAA